jgi:hypothetical protein
MLKQKIYIQIVWLHRFALLFIFFLALSCAQNLWVTKTTCKKGPCAPANIYQGEKIEADKVNAEDNVYVVDGLAVEDQGGGIMCGASEETFAGKIIAKCPDGQQKSLIHVKIYVSDKESDIGANKHFHQSLTTNPVGYFETTISFPFGVGTFAKKDECCTTVNYQTAVYVLIKVEGCESKLLYFKHLGNPYDIAPPKEIVMSCDCARLKEESK